MEDSASIIARVDRSARGGSAVVFTLHQRGAIPSLHVTLDLTFHRIDIEGTSGVEPAIELRGLSVAHLSAAAAAALPSDPAQVGADNLLAPSAANPGVARVPTSRVLLGGTWVGARKHAAAYLRALRPGHTWTLHNPSEQLIAARASANAAALSSAQVSSSASSGGSGSEGGEAPLSPLQRAVAEARGEYALGRGSQVCGGAQHVSQGCLDGWLWTRDWLNYNEPGELPYAFT